MLTSWLKEAIYRNCPLHGESRTIWILFYNWLKTIETPKIFRPKPVVNHSLTQHTGVCCAISVSYSFLKHQLLLQRRKDFTTNWVMIRNMFWEMGCGRGKTVYYVCSGIILLDQSDSSTKIENKPYKILNG